MRPPPRYLITALLLLEFASLTALLGLFGYAHPNAYRTALRSIGVNLGLNAPPASATPLSSYAASLSKSDASTSATGPTDPLVFRDAATAYTLWITIASFILLVSQAVLAILGSLNPVFALVVNAALEAVWIVSAAVMQAGVGAGGERPWWVGRSCGLVHEGGGGVASYGWCRQAQAALGISAGMCVLYGCVMAWSVWMWVARRGRRRGDGWEDDEGEGKLKEVEIEIDPYCMSAGRFD
ncbi:hypothetical protein EDC01DRAFT_628432 [Geopyxis carbonaria]|nr:hypothetical protein EDC01DRAFT_628432 [Geopyxis carbonaria]